jgi:serine/threonine-protein kinase
VNARQSTEPDAGGSLVGRTLADRYLVERLLGEGGMGSVYAARQLGLERLVAVKVIRAEIAAGAVEAERFRREALAAARLDHPNIVTVYDFGRLEDGSSYLVMELLTGPTLDRVLAADRTPDPAAVVSVFEPVCDAVDALHAAGIIHRDIKPANIALPDEANADDVVKLIDLGIARFSDASHGDLTGHLVIGTADYIAPEVAMGKPAGPASDIYALGVTAFEALAGRPPFTGETDRDVLIKHIREPVPSIRRIRRDLPAAFDGALAVALAKDPEDRFATAKAFARALRNAAVMLRTEPAKAPARRARAILLVESDAATREFARGCLAAFGYEVTEAADAVEALLRLGGGTFDLVIANADLPVLDGLTLVRLKLEKGIRTPTLLITPDGRLPDSVAADTHGVAAAVKLPLDAGELFGAVSAALADG